MSGSGRWRSCGSISKDNSPPPPCARSTQSYGSVRESNEAFYQEEDQAFRHADVATRGERISPEDLRQGLESAGPGCEEGLRGGPTRLPRRAAESRARKLSPLAQTRQRPVVSREIARAGLAGADGGA